MKKREEEREEAEKEEVGGKMKTHHDHFFGKKQIWVTFLGNLNKWVKKW